MEHSLTNTALHHDSMMVSSVQCLLYICSQSNLLYYAGLRLLGFKSRSMLKHYHQLRSPTFLYPDERSMSGSTQTFIAFHATMLKKQKMAICSFVRTKAAEPRLVALLPQEEEVDEFGAQVGH